MKQKTNKIILYLMLIELSLALNYFIPIAVLEPILDKLLFNTLSILIGLTILISSVLIFTSKPQLIKVKGGKKKKERIYQINTNESTVYFKKNIYFSLFTFIILIGLILIKEMQLPNLKWQLIQQPLSLRFFYNALLIFGIILIFWSIIDFIKLIFNFKHSIAPLKSKRNKKSD